MTAAWSVNRLAARGIVWNNRHLPVSEVRELLDMIGVIDGPDGRSVLPDDTRSYAAIDPSTAPGAKDPNFSSPRAFAEDGRRPAGMTTPPGLAHLPPPEDRPRRKKQRPAPPRADAPAPAGQRLAPCGSYSAYLRHKRRGEPVDDTCMTGARAYWRSKSTAGRDAQNPGRTRKKSALASACGTMTGYRRHRRNGEDACPECTTAARAEWFAQDEARRQAKGAPRATRRTKAACGTRSGYMRHRRLGETACGPCKAANNHRVKTANAARSSIHPARREDPSVPAAPPATDAATTTGKDGGRS